MTTYTLIIHQTHIQASTCALCYKLLWDALTIRDQRRTRRPSQQRESHEVIGGKFTLGRSDQACTPHAPHWGFSRQRRRVQQLIPDRSARTCAGSGDHRRRRRNRHEPRRVLGRLTGRVCMQSVHRSPLPPTRIVPQIGRAHV